MNVSCRGVLMKEVESEKEAMDEIKRYLEVNGLECNGVGICVSKELDKDTKEVLGEYKVVYVGTKCGHGDTFVIRYTTMPPCVDVEETADKYEAKKTVKRRDGEVLWIDEFRNYIRDLSRRTGGC